MKTLLILITLFTLNSLIYSQTPSIIWQNNFGGSWNDAGTSICKTTDGGLMIAGNTRSDDGNVIGNHGSVDCWLLKLDINYEIEWQKCYGGSESDATLCIIQTSDQGYIFSASSNSLNGDLTENFGSLDIWVVKLNSEGEIIWQKSIGSTNADYGQHIIETNVGDFIVAGKWTNPDNYDDLQTFIIKLDFSGTIQWQKYFGGSLQENANCIIQTNDNGFVFVGESNSSDGDLTDNYGGSDCWIAKIDSVGNLIWQKNIGGSSDDYASCIIQNYDGSYIMTGSTRSNDYDVSGNHGELDSWIVKLDSNGYILWQKCYGGSSTDRAENICSTPNSHYIFTGATFSEDGDVSGKIGSSDFWIVEIDNDGEIIWQKCFGGTKEDYSFQIENTDLNKYAIVGVSGSNDVNVSGNYGLHDYWIMKIDTEVGVNENLTLQQITLSPNPTDGKILVKSEIEFLIEIRNSLGKKILSREIFGSSTIDISNHPNGVYLVQLKDLNRKNIETKKIIKY